MLNPTTRVFRVELDKGHKNITINEHTEQGDLIEPLHNTVEFLRFADQNNVNLIRVEDSNAPVKPTKKSFTFSIPADEIFETWMMNIIYNPKTETIHSITYGE